MKTNKSDCSLLAISGLIALATVVFTQSVLAASAGSPEKPYKIVNSSQTMGSGGIDYVYADSDGRRLYIPRGSEVLVFDLDTLKAAGLRVETDLRNEKINYKVREHSLAKVPYLLVAGRREAENRTLTLRRLGSDAQENLALSSVLHMLKEEAVPPDMR